MKCIDNKPNIRNKPKLEIVEWGQGTTQLLVCMKYVINQQDMPKLELVKIDSYNFTVCMFVGKVGMGLKNGKEVWTLDLK